VSNTNRALQSNRPELSSINETEARENEFAARTSDEELTIDATKPSVDAVRLFLRLVAIS